MYRRAVRDFVRVGQRRVPRAPAGHCAEARACGSPCPRARGCLRKTGLSLETGVHTAGRDTGLKQGCRPIAEIKEVGGGRICLVS